MTCCRSNIGAGVTKQFSEKRAAKDLAQYLAKGPGSTTHLLLEGLAKAGAQQGTLLDVGSGIGTLTFELLQIGLTSAVGIDLSSAYVATASNEASRRGWSGCTQFVQGDFVDLGRVLQSADIVALDRVVCCYPDCDGLLDESLRHADRYLALSYPTGDSGTCWSRRSANDAEIHALESDGDRKRDSSAGFPASEPQSGRQRGNGRIVKLESRYARTR
jgi:SAM-dependent methyltransferase